MRKWNGRRNLIQRSLVLTNGSDVPVDFVRSVVNCSSFVATELCKLDLREVRVEERWSFDSITNFSFTFHDFLIHRFDCAPFLGLVVQNFTLICDLGKKEKRVVSFKRNSRNSSECSSKKRKNRLNLQKICKITHESDKCTVNNPVIRFYRIKSPDSCVKRVSALKF